jgi:copper chaperone CopZ
MIMETLKFKTNIKCAACVAKVTSALNESVGEDKWSVDIQNPAKILSIESEAKAGDVKSALEKVGYTAEPISD